ncbi:hypothetical protein GCM10011498_38090 [Amylibacter cionae]|uniref:Uncharacterized protein n=1 Tax=Neptunicoccus cionae TaxID=2035344 RepID=A0A916VTZ7_9RHOB|nr:hypothetical protein GCM10011498_38090 [Amylibacter cionae]
MFVQPPGKLDITTDGIDGLADPQADQRHFEFIAEIPQNIEKAALFAVGPGQEVVDFVDHDHPQAKVAQERDDTDFEGGHILSARAQCRGRCPDGRQDVQIEPSFVGSWWCL